MALPYLNRALEIDPADEGSWLKIALGTSYLKPGLAFTAASKFFPKHSFLIETISDIGLNLLLRTSAAARTVHVCYI